MIMPVSPLFFFGLNECRNRWKITYIPPTCMACLMLHTLEHVFESNCYPNRRFHPLERILVLRFFLHLFVRNLQESGYK